MTPIESLLVYLPEEIVATMAAVTLVACIYSYVRCRDYVGLSFAVPALFIMVTYILFALEGPDDETRRFYARLGILMLLTDILIWRVVEIRRQARRNNKDGA